MNKLSNEDIDRIVKAYEQRAEIEKFSHVATIDEIRKNNFNCNIPRYVNTFEKEEEVDIQKVRSELVEITAKKQVAIDKMNQILKLLGRLLVLIQKVDFRTF